MIGVSNQISKNSCSTRAKSQSHVSRIQNLRKVVKPRCKSSRKNKTSSKNTYSKLLKILKPSKMMTTSNLGSRLSKFAYIGKRPYRAFSIKSDSNSQSSFELIQRRSVKKRIKGASKNPGEFIKMYSKEKIQIFPIFKDSDLNFMDEGLVQKMQRNGFDDDNDTNESLKDKGVRKMFHFMKKAVRDARKSEYGSVYGSVADSWDQGSLRSVSCNSMIEVDNSGTTGYNAKGFLGSDKGGFGNTRND